MKPDALIIRDQKEFSPKEIYNNYKIPIINAGDGAHEHPTQALLDCYSIRERLGDVAYSGMGKVKENCSECKLKYNIELIAPD